MKRCLFLSLVLALILFLSNIPSQSLAAENDWSPIVSGTTQQLTDIWGSSENDIFVVGSGGTILRYDGSHWTTMASGVTASLEGVWGSSSSDVYAVGYDTSSSGIILHYDGSNWSTVASSLQIGVEPFYLTDIWGSSGSDIYAVGEYWVDVGGGGPWRPAAAFVHYDGSTWDIGTTFVGWGYTDIWGTSSSNIFMIGNGRFTSNYGGHIDHYNGNGWTQTDYSDVVFLSGIWGSSSSDIYAVGGACIPQGETQPIVHYDGSSWNDVDGFPIGEIDKSFFGIWGTSPSNVYAVGSNGTVLHYDASTWNPMNSGTANSLFGIWGSSANDIFAVGSGGTILHYGPTPTATFGLNGGNGTFNLGANSLEGMRFQNTAGTGMLNKLELLVNDNTPSGKVRMGVYADNIGKPGPLLLDAGEVTVTNGWISKSGLNLAVTANTYYWLAFNLQNSNTLQYQTGYPAKSHYWSSATYGSLPSSFPIVTENTNSSPYVMRATVTLGPVPLYANDDAYTVNEDNPLDVSAPGVLGNDSGSNLTAIKISNPAHGSVTLNANGSFIYTPTANYNGSDSFSYEANDGSADSNVATVTITVNPGSPAILSLSTPPVAGASVDDIFSTQPVILVTDQFGNPVSGVTITTSRGTGTGTLRGTLTATTDTSGLAEFTDLGYDKSGEAFTLRFAAGSLSVNSASLGPLAAGTPTQVRIETAANGSGTVVAARQLTNGTTLTVYAIIRDQYNNYVGNIDAAWSLTNKTGEVADSDLSPATGASAVMTGNKAGTCTIHAAITGLTSVDSGTIIVVNDLPVADAKTVSTDQDTAQTITLSGSDVETVELTFAAGSPPAHGSLSAITNNPGIAGSPNTDSADITYTPAAGYSGSDSFTYTVGDGTATSSPVTVSITINPPGNTAPIASNQSVATNEDIALPIVLTATDVDGDPLSFAITPPAHGELTGTASNFTYTPAGDYNGPDNFTFQAYDGSLTSNTATVTITVNPVNDPPIAVADAYTATRDTQLNIAPPGILASDTDIDGNPLTSVKVTDPAHGTLNWNNNGSFTYTPAANYIGSDSFTYKANDSHDDSNVANVSIRINPQPIGPATQARVETAANGSGTVVTARRLTIGTKLTVYAITRDQYGNFVANPADAAWFLTNKTGGIADSDLSPETGASAVMTGNKAGTCTIHTAITGLTSADSGPITVAARSSGGGGGGGGGETYNTITLNGLVSATPLKLDRQGIIQGAAQVKSSDGKVILDITNGTKLLTSTNSPLPMLKAVVMDPPPAPLAGNAVVMACTFGPEGSRFSTPLTLTMIYDPTKLATGMSEKDLYIARYDGTQWQPLESSVKSQGKKVTTKISGFSDYALLYKLPAPSPTPIADTTPVPTQPSPTPIPSPVEATSYPSVPVQPVPSEVPSPGSVSILSVQTDTPAPPAISPEQPKSEESKNWTWLFSSIALIVVVITIFLILKKSPDKSK